MGDAVLLTVTGRNAVSAGTTRTRYLHKDHLGSITSITDESGQETESFSFDAWGKRRAPTLASLIAKIGSPWTSLGSFQRANLTISAGLLGSGSTNRGFTGHEQLDATGLIHMGGRVYDAELGRFLSADPYVQDGTDLQSLNRYSYVANNPLSAWDPSGFFLRKLFGRTVDAIGDGLRAVGGVVKRALQRVGRVFEAVPGLRDAVAAWFCGPAAVGCLATFNAVLTAAITVANGGSLMQTLSAAAVAYTQTRLAGAAVSPSGEGAGDYVMRITSDAVGGEGPRDDSGQLTGRLAELMLETATRRAGRQSSGGSSNPPGDVRWPTDYRHVTAVFGETRRSGPHNGVDIRALMGTPIYSTEAGEVIRINESSRGGNQVFVRNASGSISGYAHTAPVDGLRVGAHVRAGEQIGVSNGSGGVPPHLHYTYRPGTPLQPAQWDTPVSDPIGAQLIIAPLTQPAR